MKIDLVTRFFDIDGNQLGNAVGILPIPLCKGMTIKVVPRAFNTTNNALQ